MTRLCFPAILVLAAGCLGDVEHTNPLDPMTPGFEEVGGVEGTTTQYYPPFRPLPSVEVILEPGGWITRSDAQGRFSFSEVSTGTYTLSAGREAYQAAPDTTIEVRLGQRTQLDLRLDGLPRLNQLRLSTHHVSRWWPQEDLYFLTIEAEVDDPDGVADLRNVWLEIPHFQFVDTLNTTATPGRFVRTLNETDLPGARLQALLGHPIIPKLQDQAGAINIWSPQTLSRIIEVTPQTLRPQEQQSLSDAQPTLEWVSVNVPYDFTYQVDIVRVDANVQTLVQSYPGLSSDAAQLQVAEPLPGGTYYWTLLIEDTFGNQSRSKEAGFVIQ